jgi:hypothetical protein
MRLRVGLATVVLTIAGYAMLSLVLLNYLQRRLSEESPRER